MDDDDDDDVCAPRLLQIKHSNETNTVRFWIKQQSAISSIPNIKHTKVANGGDRERIERNEQKIKKK